MLWRLQNDRVMRLEEAHGEPFLTDFCSVLGTVMGTHHLPTNQAYGELKTSRDDFSKRSLKSSSEGEII